MTLNMNKHNDNYDYIRQMGLRLSLSCSNLWYMRVRVSFLLFESLSLPILYVPPKSLQRICCTTEATNQQSSFVESGEYSAREIHITDTNPEQAILRAYI